MDSLWNLFFVGDKFLGIEWHAWKIIGWFGNVAFFSRFLVQWYATEKQKRVVVPIAFWWLSLAGSLLLLAYAVFYRKDSVFIFAYAFTWIPYIRNLIIHRRAAAGQIPCPGCGLRSPQAANFCSACGTSLRQSEPQG
ncbi:MAG: lipid-A-disaccharide synthase N-terminal domain-containing protein [Verrucomicrobiota bacterium]